MSTWWSRNISGGYDPDIAKDTVGRLLIKWSGGALLLLVGTIVAGIFLYEPPDGAQKPTFAEYTGSLMAVLTAILPVIGTWVGTVLSYYFSKENFREAAQATKELAQINSAEKLRRTPARDHMKAFDEIKNLRHVTNDAGKTITELLQPMGIDGVGRMIVWDGTRVTHVFQDNLIRQVQAVQQAANPQVAGTLRSLLDDPKAGPMAASIGFAPATASLGEVLAIMQSKGANCRDVFLTEGGKPELKPIGWITDHDIRMVERS